MSYPFVRRLMRVLTGNFIGTCYSREMKDLASSSNIADVQRDQSNLKWGIEYIKWGKVSDKWVFAKRDKNFSLISCTSLFQCLIAVSTLYNNFSSIRLIPWNWWQLNHHYTFNCLHSVQTLVSPDHKLPLDLSLLVWTEIKQWLHAQLPEFFVIGHWKQAIDTSTLWCAVTKQDTKF